MKKLYKEGKECMADDEQVDVMKKSGWTNKPVVVEEVKASEPEPDTEDAEEEADVVEAPKAKPKVAPKRKVIKKKTDSKE